MEKTLGRINKDEKMRKVLRKITREINNPEDFIFTGITEKELEERLQEQLRKKRIRGEQWFRKAEKWFSMSAWSNPYKTPYHELRILTEHQNDIGKYITRTSKIFYGVGVGDTESIIVENDLRQEGYSEICAIDVNVDFLFTFLQTLRNLKIEFDAILKKPAEIWFLGYNTLFEKLTPADLEVEKDDPYQRNPKYKTRTHICFGNTIGNYLNQDEIFDLFRQNSKKGDYLLLGYHLNKDPEKLLSQYKENYKFEDLILDPVKKISIKNLVLRTLFRKKIKWTYENGFVKAWFNGILIFQSKKYNPEELNYTLKQYGFEAVSISKDNKNYFKFGDCGVSLFVKKV